MHDPALAPIRLLRAPVPAGRADAALDALGGFACRAAVWTAEEDAVAELRLYLAPEDDEPAAAEALRTALAVGREEPPETAAGHPAHAPAVTPIQREMLPAEDWTEGWKRFFRAERVSARIVVCPAWLSWPVAGDERVIYIDPGMSFGTGQHATTRACLRFLDALARNGAGGGMLDLGCGSGILCAAAAHLGYAPVTGVDHDPVATACATETLRRNGLEHRVRLVTADLAAAVADLPPAAVVTANILAPVLSAQARRIGAAVAPAGHLILAGMLHDQYPAVRDEYRRLEFVEIERRTDGEWCAGLMRR